MNASAALLSGTEEAAIDADALLALRLLPDEPERAMRVHDETLRRAEALGHERGLLRLRIVRLNERARRTGDRAALSQEMAQAAKLAADRHWPVEALLLGLLDLFLLTLLDDHAQGAREAERLQPLAEQHLEPVELSWLDIMTGHFRGYLVGWAEEQKRAYLSLKRLVDSPAAPPGLIANTKKNIGYSHLLVQNLDLARNFLQEAYRGYEALPMTPRKLSALKAWAQCLLEFGEVAQADAVLAPVLSAVLGDRAAMPGSLYLASALLVGAEVKLLLGNAATARACAVAAAPALNAAAEPAILTHQAYVRALLLIGGAEPDAALAAAQRGCDLITPHTHEVVVQKCLGLSAQLYADAGQFERAYRQQSRLLALRREMARKAGEIRHVELHIDHQAQIDRMALAHVQQARLQAEAAEATIARKNAELEQRLAEVERLQETLREQANRDVLTGLFNRRYLRSMFPALRSQTGREHAPVTLALIDIDHFKRVNDEHGHQMGDAVLTGFSALLLSHFRGHDLCCRYGGEEFCVVMIGIGAAQARQRIEALQAEFARLVVRDGLHRVGGLGFSAGLVEHRSEAPDPGFDLDEALRLADVALYAAKDAGRGQVVVANAGG